MLTLLHFFNIILSFAYIALKWTRIMNAMATCNHIGSSARFIKTEEDYCVKTHLGPVHGLLANVMSTWVNISSRAYYQIQNHFQWQQSFWQHWEVTNQCIGDIIQLVVMLLIEIIYLNQINVVENIQIGMYQKYSIELSNSKSKAQYFWFNNYKIKHHF